MSKLSNISLIPILTQLIQFILANSEKLTDTKTTLIALADNFEVSCSNTESKRFPGEFSSLELPQNNPKFGNSCKLSLIAPNGQFIVYECSGYQNLYSWHKEVKNLGWVCENIINE